MASTTSLSPQSTAWAIMAGLGLFMILAPVGGWLADRGPPKVWTLMSLCLGVSAVSIPVMFGLHSSAFVVVLLMVTLMLGACGCMGGLLTSIGPEMYPAGVRITGYALGESRVNPLLACWLTTTWLDKLCHDSTVSQEETCKFRLRSRGP